MHKNDVLCFVSYCCVCSNIWFGSTKSQSNIFGIFGSTACTNIHLKNNNNNNNNVTAR